MAVTEFFLPQAYSDAYKCLFPTIDLNRVHFFKGIPLGLDVGQPAITTENFGDQRVYIRTVNEQAFCDTISFVLFLTIAHEFVHVLQIQQGGSRLSWYTRYITCWITSGFSTKDGNCYEQEAYDYANGLSPTTGALKIALTSTHVLPPPYTCHSMFGFPVTNPDFCNVVLTTAPRFQKTSTHCSFGDCLSQAGWLPGLLTLLLLPFIGLGTLLGVNLGTIVGAVVGLIVGVVAGFFIGLGLGFLVGAIIGAIVGAVVGLIVGALVGGLIALIVERAGDSGGNLNVVVSGDGGLSFANKKSFEKTREQFSLVMGISGTPSSPSAVLSFAWTGLDDQVNFEAFANDPTKNRDKLSFERSNHCGPALAIDPATGMIAIAWQGNDNRLNLLSSNDGGASFPPNTKYTLDGTRSDPEATPGLVFGDNGVLYLSWVDQDGWIHIGGTQTLGADWIFQTQTFPRSGINWEFQSVAQGTAALAFGNGKLFLAFIERSVHTLGTPPMQHLGHMIWCGIFEQLADGNIQFSSVQGVPGGGPLDLEGADDATGPAIAYDLVLDRLYVSWVAENQSDLVLASSSPTRIPGGPLPTGAWWANRVVLSRPDGVLEQSRGNAGPALTAGGGGVVVWGWTGRA